MTHLFNSLDWLSLSIVVYIFMRAFEVEFSGSRERGWYRVAVRIIAGITLVVAGLSIVAIFSEDRGGFKPKKQPVTAVTDMSPDGASTEPPAANAEGGEPIENL